MRFLRDEIGLHAIEKQSRERLIAMLISGVSIPFPAPAVTAAEVRTHGTRRISAKAERGLEILGHAIDYLTDEYVHDDGGSMSDNDPCVEAIQLLMGRHREIYIACPETPSFADRIRAWFHRN